MSTMYTICVLMAAPAVVLGNNPDAAIDSSPSLRGLASDEANGRVEIQTGSGNRKISTVSLVPLERQNMIKSMVAKMNYSKALSLLKEFQTKNTKLPVELVATILAGPSAGKIPKNIMDMIDSVTLTPIEDLLKKDCDTEECIRDVIRKIRLHPSTVIPECSTEYDFAKCRTFFSNIYLKNFVCHKSAQAHRDACASNIVFGTSQDCIDCFGKVFEEPGFRWFWTCEAKCQAPTSAPTTPQPHPLPQQ